MLLLTCPNRGGSSYRLTADKPHIVGRTVGDMILAEDQSVSRKHAVIKVISTVERGDSCQVTVTDLGSKYGTYVNETTKLEANSPYVLKDGDKIKFGCQWNEWKFDSKPLVVTSSTLPAEMKLSLKNIISELGGTLVSDWQDSCSHLTMAKIILTAKVVTALASAVPIVTPEYWTSFKEAIEQKELPPNPEEYVPPLNEIILNKNKVSFAVNENRRKIFDGKTFVFPTEKQMKKYRVLISAAGGNSISLSACNWEPEEFCDPEIIVMQNLSDDTQYTQAGELYNEVLSLLKAKGRRPIPESELGLAILMCSLDMYCNPQYNVSNILLGGSGITISQIKNQEVLVADTPSMVGDITVKLEEPLEEKPIKKEISVDHESSNNELEKSTINIFEMETVPFGGEKNILESEAPRVEAEIKSETVPSRKRMAENGSENLRIKKAHIEEDPLDEFLSETQCGAFNFTDIFAKNKQLGNIQSRKDSESSKRKLIESEEATSNHQPNKSHFEDHSSKAKPGCSKDSYNNYTTPVKQALTTEVGSSKTFEGSFSKKINSSEKETKTSEMNCKSREKRDSSVLDESEEVPSTSEGWNNDNESFKREKKKAKWNNGMAAGILDMVVKMEDLIVERPSPITKPDVPQYKINFKKFKKVRPATYKNSLPEIIGESDLVCTSI